MCQYLGVEGADDEGHEAGDVLLDILLVELEEDDDRQRALRQHLHI
jgi:hypothetical protein